MKFKDAPIGARFRFIGDDVPKDIYVKIHANDDGLVVKWNGNVQGHIFKDMFRIYPHILYIL